MMTPRWDWEGPSNHEERDRLFIRWTVNKLAAEKSAEEERLDARHATIDPNLDAEREAHPIHRAIIARNIFISNTRMRILAAIKSKNWKEFARLTKDDELREWAAREVLAPDVGRRKGERRKGQRFIDKFEAEMLDSLADDVRRIRAIWEARGLTRTAKLFVITATQVAVEALLGPEKDWERLPKEILAAYPDASALTWEKRRDNLESNLINWMKNKRTKPRRRKSRRKSRR
jgi:hypothetical protein